MQNNIKVFCTYTNLSPSDVENTILNAQEESWLPYNLMIIFENPIYQTLSEKEQYVQYWNYHESFEVGFYKENKKEFSQEIFWSSEFDEQKTNTDFEFSPDFINQRFSEYISIFDYHYHNYPAKVHFFGKEMNFTYEQLLQNKNHIIEYFHNEFYPDHIILIDKMNKIHESETSENLLDEIDLE